MTGRGAPPSSGPGAPPSSGPGTARRGSVGAPASRRGRLLAAGAVALLCFGIGYLLAARVLFPAPEGESVGPLAVVPEVVGLSLEAAAGGLREEGLEPEVLAEIHHPEATPGTVIAQNPLAGQFAAPGAPVQLTLSAGVAPRRVPELRGVAPRQAALVLERMGFAVRTRAVDEGGGFSGVQGTRPAAGEDVSPPYEVELLVAEGPQVVVVPSLGGRHVDDVEALLEEVGLRLGSVRFDGASAAAPGRVIGQSPPAGYSLRGGGYVSIEVAGSPGESGASPPGASATPRRPAAQPAARRTGGAR